MRRRLVVKKRRKKHGTEPEEQRPVAAAKNASVKKKPRGTPGAFYKTGPILAMPAIIGAAKPKKTIDATAKDKSLHTLASNLKTAPPAMLQAGGKGTQSRDSAKGGSVRLEGRTDADFDGGSFETRNVRVSAAHGCDSCGAGDPCIRARGVLVARYHVTTTVTLPSAADFPDLTPCQRARVQHAIDTVLAPHEQRHVRAFRHYNGVVRTPFDVTLCRSAFDGTIRGLFDRQESARRAAAQAASDALDPFHFDVDIDCEEPPEHNTAGGTGTKSEPDTAVGRNPSRPAPSQPVTD